MKKMTSILYNKLCIRLGIIAVSFTVLFLEFPFYPVKYFIEIVLISDFL
jgi:hypothetical protein